MLEAAMATQNRTGSYQGTLQDSGTKTETHSITERDECCDGRFSDASKAHNPGCKETLSVKAMGSWKAERIVTRQREVSIEDI